MSAFSLSHVRSGLTAVSLTAALLACSGDDASGGGATTGDAGRGVGCSQDPRVKTFAAGMQAKSSSGKLVVEIVNASPSPPQRGAGDAGINAWTVKVTADGQPATGPVEVKALMPDHGHSSPKAPVIAANPDGTFAVTNLFLFMGGVWEISFSTSPQETATFTLCVE